MVPAEQWERLQAKYRGSVNQSALLNKIGRLGATEELLLHDESIPAGMAVALAKPLAQQRTNLTKRLKTGQMGSSASYGTTEEEPEAMMDTPAVALVKRLFKKEPQTPATPLPAPKRKLPTTPSTSGLSDKQKKTLLATYMKGIKGAAKKGTKAVGFDTPWGEDNDDSYIEPPGSFEKKKGKKKAKHKQTEAEKLQEGAPNKFKRGPLLDDYSSEDESIPWLFQDEDLETY